MRPFRLRLRLRTALLTAVMLLGLIGSSASADEPPVLPGFVPEDPPPVLPVGIDLPSAPSLPPDSVPEDPPPVPY